MSDLAERIRELTQHIVFDEGDPRDRNLASVVIANAQTILAGLAALEERDKLRAALQKIADTASLVEPDCRCIMCYPSQVAKAALQPTPEQTDRT